MPSKIVQKSKDPEDGQEIVAGSGGDLRLPPPPNGTPVSMLPTSKKKYKKKKNNHTKNRRFCVDGFLALIALLCVVSKFSFDGSPSFVNIFTPKFDGRVARDALSTHISFSGQKILK